MEWGFELRKTTPPGSFHRDAQATPQAPQIPPIDNALRREEPVTGLFNAEAPSIVFPFSPGGQDQGLRPIRSTGELKAGRVPKKEPAIPWRFERFTTQGVHVNSEGRNPLHESTTVEE